MRFFSALSTTLIAVSSGLFVSVAFAQQPADSEKAANIESEKKSAEGADIKPSATNVSAKTQPSPKMVQDATINLQTTITGNQEQPRVLYILPWQSPHTTDVDFEPLDNTEKSVFGHVEREELRRQLESTGELQ